MTSNIDLIREKTFGAQDVALNSLQLIEFSSEQLFTVKKIFKTKENEYEIYKFNCNPYLLLGANGISNVNIFGNPKNIKNIDLTGGGILINRIYPELNGDMNILPKFKNYAFPLAEYNPLEIHINFIGEIIIEIDIVKITNAPMNNNKIDGANFLTLNTQYLTNIKNIHNRCSLIFYENEQNIFEFHLNHPINKLCVVYKKGIKYFYNATIKINVHNETFFIPFTFNQINETTGEFLFSKPINFSRANNSFFVLKDIIDQNYDIHIFAETIQVVRILQGMIGMAFSK